MTEAGGTGSRDILEVLFGLISQAQEPVSVPFWVELLDYVRPRDQYAERRRTHALAGLARLVIRRDDPAALAALRAATHHPCAEVRGLAVHYLGRALLFEEFDGEEEGQGEDRPPRPLPLDILAELNEIAVSDPVSAPAFRREACCARRGSRCRWTTRMASTRSR